MMDDYTKPSRNTRRQKRTWKRKKRAEQARRQQSG